MSSLESEFKRILGAPADLETWAQWLQSAVNKALENVKAKETLVQAARQFLLNWSFYRYKKKVFQHFFIVCLWLKIILKSLKIQNVIFEEKNVKFERKWILKKCEFWKKIVNLKKIGIWKIVDFENFFIENF